MTTCYCPVNDPDRKVSKTKLHTDKVTGEDFETRYLGGGGGGGGGGMQGLKGLKKGTVFVNISNPGKWLLI